MLQKIRSKSGSLVIKIILSIIGISFLAFGIGDIVRIIMSTPPVAKIGRKKIQFQDFYNQYHQILNNLGRRKSPTPNELETLPDSVVEEMVKQTAILNEIESIGIIASKQVVIDSVKSIPLFYSNGEFDPEIFQNALRNMGMSQGMLFKDMENHLREQQLFAPMTYGVKINAPYADLLVNTIENKKVFEVAFVPDEIITLKKSSESKLRKYLEKNKEKYTVPEERKIDVCIIRHQKLQDLMTITNEELENGVKEMQDSLISKEQRAISKFVCKKEAEAETIRQTLLKIQSLDKVSRHNPDAKVEDLGAIEKERLPENIQDSVFSLAKGESFGPVFDGQNFVVYVVTDIIPAVTNKTDETAIKTEIKQDIQKRKMLITLEEAKNQIEDALAAGMPFSEIINKFSERYCVEYISLNISKENGTEVIQQNGFKTEISESMGSAAFEIDEGGDSQFIDSNGISVILRVSKITAKHCQDFEKIQEKIEKDWEKDEKTRLEYEWLQNQFSEAINTPNKWKEIVDKNKCKSQKISISSLDLFRGEYSNIIFDIDKLQMMMLLKQNHIEFYKTKDGQTVAIYVKGVVKDVAGVLNEGKNRSLEEIRAKINESIENDISQLSRQSIRNKYKVTINKKVVNSVRNIAAE